MSSVDAGFEPAAVAQPRAVSGKKHERLKRHRLELIYFALAAFDLVTIILTLLLSDHIMGLYQQSVARSAAWSARVGELVELAQYAQEANAPGNDVFDSGDVHHERSRRDESLEAYARQRDAVLRELDVSVPRVSAQLIGERIRSADRHMREMMHEADSIFSEIEMGDDEAAGRRMATMDRVYAHLTHSLLEAIIKVQEVEDANLRRQVALATQLKQLEHLVMALIFFIVIGVAFYGRRIGQVMRATEDAHNGMLVDLETANEGLQEYADNVAHELRNPVNKVLLASEVALSRPRAAEEYQDTLVSIVEECQRLSSIVGSLLFLARARRTKVDIERQSINVGVELERIRAYFEASAQEAGVSLILVSEPSLGLNVDKTLFQRAVSNLVSNAIAHTPPGGSVALRAAGDAAHVTIQVSDTGEGVSDEAQARVFDRFYRADAARSSSSGRIGLGLPIAKSIMELHGGAISLRSRIGEGTVVTLDFPL